MFAYQESVISSKDEQILKQARELKGERMSLMFMSDKFVEVSDLNDKNKKLFEEYKKEQEEIRQAVYRSHKEELNRLNKLNKQLQRIANAKPEDDAPISPVMLDTLKWMREEDSLHSKDSNGSAES